jgi:acyl carrier protein
MADQAEIEQAVKGFLLEAFLPGEDPDELTRETELVSSGILDSVATLRLVTFLEERFGIQVEPHEADEEHLNTLASIAELVAAKRARGAPRA